MSTATPFPVKIHVNTSSLLGALPKIHRFFGCDEPNYTYTAPGLKLLSSLGSLCSPSAKPTYFRTHNLLTTGPGKAALKWGSTNVYTLSSSGTPIYSWAILDKILSAGLSNGVQPYIQLGFMPQALSTHPEPYQHSWSSSPDKKYEDIYTGWAYPPTDYKKWGELCYEFTKHCLEKYGQEEVESWYWECWNEPNIGYWQGSQEEFYRLHDYATAGVRRALPTAKIGGPEMADGAGLNDELKRFLQHCRDGENEATGEAGTPLDFVSFHAKGQPEYVQNASEASGMEGEKHVRMGIKQQLRQIDTAFQIISTFPEYKKNPIVIGESDPDGCAACQGPHLNYRNTALYASYTAANFSRKHELARKHGVNLEGAITWAFLFNEQPFFNGMRVLNSNGIALPVFNVFRMMSMLEDNQISATSSAQIPLEEVLIQGIRNKKPDVGVLASRNEAGTRVSTLIWHYYDDDVLRPTAQIEVVIDGLSGWEEAKVGHYRVDGEYGNAFTRWSAMGNPENPSQEQYAELMRASQLGVVREDMKVPIRKGRAEVEFDLPCQGVSLIIIEKDK